MWKQQKVFTTYLIVVVKSDSAERFLNMCRNRGIVFWNIKKNEEGFRAKISRKDFLKLREPCRKTRTKVRIQKKKGLRFLMFKYRKHYSFVVGIAISFILLYFCSQYVWDISFEGNYEYTDSNLLKYLSTYQIRPGIPVKKLDCNLIESEIRNQYKDITWVSAEISGTRLVVHIKENDGAADQSTSNESTGDLVATEDGVVSSIITRSGTPLVKSGDTVTKGQILVSGVVDIMDDSKTVIGQKLTRADADIHIQVAMHYTDQLNIAYEYKEYTNHKKVKNIIRLFDNEVEFGLTFGQFEQYDTVTDINVWKLTGNFYLPISSGKKTYQEYKMKQAEYSEEEAEKILSVRLNQYMRQLIENKVQIINNSVKIETDGISYQYNGMLYLNMPAFEYAALTYTPLEMPEDENKEE